MKFTWLMYRACVAVMSLAVRVVRLFLRFCSGRVAGAAGQLTRVSRFIARAQPKHKHGERVVRKHPACQIVGVCDVECNKQTANMN
jgi:hypothetical protein